MRVLAVLTALATLAVAAPVHAEFAFTKWGMTREQVVAAGGGLAVVNGKNIDIKNGYTLAGIHFADSGFAFEEGRLWAVLLYEPNAEPSAVRAALVAAYGSPLDNHVWVDLKNNLSMSFSADNGSIMIQELPPEK